MQELGELVSIITKSKLKSLERKGVSMQWDARLQAFYQLISEGTVRTDDEAKALLFKGEKSLGPYNRLKADLKSFLLDKLFLIDIQEQHYHARQKAYFECYKNWAAIKILQGKRARRLPAALAEETLKKAIKFEFTDLAQEMARTLRLHYGSIEGDHKRHQHYSRLADTYEKIYQWENESEELYTYLITHYVNSKSTKKQIHEQAKLYWIQLKQALETYDSYRLQLCGRLIETTIYSSINDYKATIELCEKAISFFEQKPFVAGVPLQAFLFQEMVCYVQLKDYTRGKLAAERGMKLLEEGAFNWFKYQELLLMLSLHAQEYSAAYHIFTQTVKHKKFDSLPGNLREYWKVMEAFLFYLIESGYLRLASKDSHFSKFRIARFVNETPIYAKDKRGMNIPILVIQILFLLANKRYDDLLERMEAIEKYASRYLRNDDTYRSSCFIKMLLQIPAQGYHRVAVTRHAAKYVQLLKKIPIDVANQSHDIEIIPYEDLWEMALQLLTSKN